MFTRPSSDGTFTQQAKLHANDAAAEDNFGASVSLYGDTALIGTDFDDDVGKSNSGSVYVFTRRALMGRLHNSLNSTRMIRCPMIISVFPFLYSAIRR